MADIEMAPLPQVRLDLGCGKAKLEGWTGVDVKPFDGVDVACDIGVELWPWEDGSVDEARASHVVEHLTPQERIHFVNELYRVLRPEAKCLIIVPHWASCRAYGDLTHQWPPVSEFWFYYLNTEWRKVNAPHNDEYQCNFEHTIGYGVNPVLQCKSQENRDFALSFYKEAAMDLVATVVKR